MPPLIQDETIRVMPNPFHIVRIVFAFMLIIAYAFYIAEFITDQSDDIGKWAQIWHEKVTTSKVVYPGHQGEALYILLFVTITFFTMIGFLAACCLPRLWLLFVFCAGYIIAVIIDGIALGRMYATMGYWFGWGTVLSACIAWLTAIGWIVMIYRDPQNDANNNNNNNNYNMLFDDKDKNNQMNEEDSTRPEATAADAKRKKKKGKKSKPKKKKNKQAQQNKLPDSTFY